MPYATISSAQIHYREAGSGIPLFLLHGNASSGRVWQRIIPGLATRFRVIAHDRRGFGESDKDAPPDPSPAGYARELVQLMDALGAERAHLAGLSLGGMVAQRVALDFPDRVRSLVLLGTTADRTARSVADTLQTLERDGWAKTSRRLVESWFRPESDPRDVDEAHEIAMLSSQHLRAVTVAALGRFDIRGELRNITAPTLILVGREDKTCPLAMSQTICEGIPGARMSVIPDCGHLSPVEQPETCRAHAGVPRRGGASSRRVRGKHMSDPEQANSRQLAPALAMSVRAVAVAGALYHLYVLGLSPNDPWVHRALHLALISSFVFMLWPARRTSPTTRPSVVDVVFIALALLSGGYIIYAFEDLIGRLGVLPTTTDVVFATVAVVVLLEMTRRVTGLVLPILALLFISYALFGSELPGILGHRGYSYDRTITFLYNLEGIYGPSLAASATFITLFVIFGALLNKSGAGAFFVDLSYAAAGGRRGGPAKVAVLASALFGSISGSAVSNAVTTGTFTIPLMKSVGYAPSFAAAVEAVASTGGQLMPPVMSAAAFVMAEITGISYLSIAYAAIVPSVLYFMAAYLMIDFEAKNLGLSGIASRDRPMLGRVLLERGHLILPLLVLCYALIFARTSPLQAALFGGITVIIVSWFRAATRMGPTRLFSALADGMLAMVSIATACALAGIVVGVFSLTGLGLKFADALIAFSGGQLWLALLLTMIVCIILGMGMPTVAAYVVTASAVAPALIELGVPVLAAHLFVLYFAAVSTITPPVAITVFATAGLAGAPALRVGGNAVKLAIAAYIVPFMFVYSGSLLLQGDWSTIALAVPTALLGIWALAKGAQDRSVPWPLRLVLLLAAIVLIKPGLASDLVGVGLVAAVLAASAMLSKTVAQAPRTDAPELVPSSEAPSTTRK